VNSRQIAVALLLVVAVLGTGWMLLRERERNAPAQFTGPPRSDYQLHDFELASYDDQGRLAFRLDSPRLTHDDARSAFHVDAPEFRFFNDDGNAWDATARTARIDTRSKRVAMRDQVRLTQTSGAPGERLVVTSQALDADTNARRLTSDTTVTVQRPGSILRGIGLDADLDTRHFELASAVRGRFEVRNRR
jgi:lipopolysaccharide export system protein LptC